ncbi:hypothetical protein BUALT_Bualt02G0136000 [Buddleja alternifolia]|uniref:NB-ARC domain-containing protein n=1 Tax=Buddleja alternifolia TaxID=168488 RepID=A0AAV6Y192_9LAMI|nr:hypothetical protein BUALT_Bualt02G0136000 [Buddleja alternifolia]
MGYPQVNKSDKQTEESPDSSKVHIEVEPGDVTEKEVEGEPLPDFDPTESDEDHHTEEHDQLIDYSLTRDREKRIVKAPSRSEMAYPALISVKQTIERLLNSSHLQIRDSPLCARLEYVYNELVPSIQQLVNKISSFESSSSNTLRLMASMDMRMREAVCELEDVLEFHVSNQVLSRCEGDQISYPLKLTLDFDKIEEEINCLTEVVHKIEDDYKEVNSIREDIGFSEYFIYTGGSKVSNIACWEEILQEKTCELEDLSNQLLSQYENLGDTSDDLLTSTQEIDDDDEDDDDEYKTCSSSSLIDDLESIKEESNAENLLSPPPEDDDDSVSSKTDFGGNNSKIVGLHDELSKLKLRLMEDKYFHRVVPIVGMVGIGKTTIAKQVYEDPLILNHFDCRAWVTIGPKYQKEELYRRILAQINPNFDQNDIRDDLDLTKYDEKDDLDLPKRLQDDLKLPKYVHRSLKGKRYLIVLDDVWDTEIWDKLFLRFPSEYPESRIMLTTRLEQVANHACRRHFFQEIEKEAILKKRSLSEEESWYLFCEKIFGKDLCPLELEKVGKKIVQNCEGLPLAIITIGDHLSKTEKTLDYWNKVAEKKIHVFNSINRLLFSDYEYLAQHLKPCFLYMGVFPHDYEIPASKLIKLWSTEGFLEPDLTKTLEDVGMGCLEDLASRSVVLIRKHSSRGRIKTCGIHYVFQHLCISIAEKNKFFHVLNSCPSSPTEGIEDQRRMCIHKNALLGMKDVHDLMETVSTTARSLLCTGPYHQYPVQLCFGLRLLRVLDALTIRFYTFPFEVLKLFQLRYLAMTYNGKLPASISKLWNLQYLIVKQHVSIKYKGVRSYLPIEIWYMKELRHIQVMGSDLPHPPCGSFLPNLLTLSDVSAHSCTKEVLEGIPNLKKLGIQIKLGLDNVEHLCFFHHIARLHGLESLKCIIVNPKSRSNYFVNQLTPVSIWPSGLKKLSLSGFGYPWEYMSKIGELPNLEVLKLRCYAFQGRTWKTKKGEFPKLKYLVIEDTDLKYWETQGLCFWEVERLIMRHCYKLKDIPFVLDSKVLELVDCNPFVERLAQQMKLGI